MRSSVFISLLLSLFAWMPSQALAQQAHSSISISPLIMEMEIENTKSYLRSIVVKNMNSVPYEISFEAFDVEIDPDTHNVRILPAVSKQNLQKSLASWVIPVGESSFVLRPQEERVFEFQFSVPVGVQAGDYYGSLHFYYKPLGVAQNGNISIRQSLGSLLLVSLIGEENAALSSEPYTLSRLALNRKSEVTEVALEMMNNTLRYIHVKPLITLKDDQGEIYFQKEGVSKRVFPAEKVHVIHSFPNIYLAAAENMTLVYSLWDRQQKLKLYEEEVPLDTVRGASASFDTLRSRFVLGGGLLIVILLSIYCYRYACQGSVKTNRRRSSRTKR